MHEHKFLTAWQNQEDDHLMLTYCDFAHEFEVGDNFGCVHFSENISDCNGDTLPVDS
jgi:hypothetical protein